MQPLEPLVGHESTSYGGSSGRHRPGLVLVWISLGNCGVLFVICIASGVTDLRKLEAVYGYLFPSLCN